MWATRLYCGGVGWFDHGQAHDAISDVSMDEMASFIGSASMSDRSVVNRTGLTGRYDMHIVHGTNLPPTGVDWREYSYDVFQAAVQKQLGLKLVPAAAELPTLVVDHIEKPSPN